MISVQDLAMAYRSNGKGRVLFKDLSFDIAPSDRLGVIGRNGQGKSTLIKILSGVIAPTAGRVVRGLSMSWPLGFNGGFQGSLSGLDNIRFIARIYDRPIRDVLRYVEEFSELGPALKQPVKHYSSGMRARLAFGLSLAVDFDCYLIDEVMAVGDAIFARKCESELFGKKQDRAFVIASHDMNLIRAKCNRAIIVNGGKAKVFEDVNLAIELYSTFTEGFSVERALVTVQSAND